jgi:polysaccharide biosynthesis transport protein
MRTYNKLIMGRAVELQTPHQAYPAEHELNIHDLWKLFKRRWMTVACGTLVCVFLAAVFCALSTRQYQATAELQVEKEASSSPLGVPDASGDAGSYSDPLEENIALQTQAGILNSDTLALRVINDLHLESTEDFRPKFSLVGWVLGLVTPDGPPDPQEASLESSPRRRIAALRVFGKNLKVKPVAGTRLIDVSYLNPDPKLAADIVNHLAQGLADYNFQTRHKATSQTAEWLAGQLSDLRKQSEDLQEKVAQSQRDSGVLSLGGVDAQGREQLYSSIMDKLQQATAAYSQAEQNRIQKGAVYQAALSGDPEAVSGLSGNGVTSAADSSLTLIQNLRMQLTDLQSQIGQLAAKFGPAYPKLAEMKGKADAVTESIHVEVQRVSERAKNDYTVAQQVENNARNVYLDQKNQADALNDKTIKYTILRREADESRELYETLFKQLKQAGVLADFHSNNISVVDPARVPARPAKPNIPLYLAASLAGGLLLGCFGAFVRDGIDNKIQDLSELEAQLGQATLGILPFHKESRVRLGAAIQSLPLRNALSSGARLLASVKLSETADDALGPVPNFRKSPEEVGSRFPAIAEPRSPYVEALRGLRTALLLSRSGSPPKVILVTSSVAGEGKSMLSLNLGAVLAQQGRKVLLVEADLRRPKLSRKLTVGRSEGLSSFLAGLTEDQNPLSVAVSTEEIPDLYFLPAGPVPPYPAELLGSARMREGLRVWREHFDFIIIDGSPVLPVTDSVILSSLADLTLLLARYSVTERQSLERSYRLLNSQVDHDRIGVVLNAVRQTASAYYEYYGFKDSGYGDKNHAKKSA